MASRSSLELYDAFLSRASIDRLQKLLVRYELFKRAMEVPGDIVECGVYKGSGLYTWAKLQQLLRPHHQYKMVGFDFFDTTRRMTLRYAEDRRLIEQHAAGGASREAIRRTLAAWGVTNIQLIAGNVVKTAQAYARRCRGSRIALLYLDLDTYEATQAALESLYPLVSPGGVVAFDEYGLEGYGESDAVDNFFRGRPVRLQSFPWANTPTAYVIKEGS